MSVASVISHDTTSQRHGNHLLGLFFLCPWPRTRHWASSEGGYRVNRTVSF